MVRSLIKLGSIVLAGGVILGGGIGVVVYRAATYHNSNLIGRPRGTLPEFEIAIVAFIVALSEAQALARVFAVSGKVLWISVLISIVIAVPLSLAGASIELDTFPPETARLVVIGVVFALFGLWVGAGFAKRPY